MRISRICILGLVLLSGCNLFGLPDVSILKTQYPVVHYVPQPGFSGRASGRLVKKSEKPRETYITFEKSRPANWVSLGDISKSSAGAIVVSEDWAFYQHHGYDPNQIKEALNKDVSQGRFARGASTITQQVAKNVFLDADKNMARKFKEFLLAVKLEEKFKKSKILEVYLNVIEFGEGLYGIGPAAKFYFGKSPKDLTAKEGAFLAMLLPSPKRYSVSFREKRLTQYARRTVNSILGKLVQARYITGEEKVAEQSRPLSFETGPQAPQGLDAHNPEDGSSDLPAPGPDEEESKASED